MSRLHISIATDNIAASIEDYSARLGCKPCSFVENEYALWRTDSLNFSIRQDTDRHSGQLRHLGWEDDQATDFIEEKDVNGIVWERFTAQQQAKEINDYWPEAQYQPQGDIGNE